MRNVSYDTNEKPSAEKNLKVLSGTNRIDNFWNRFAFQEILSLFVLKLFFFFN